MPGDGAQAPTDAQFAVLVGGPAPPVITLRVADETGELWATEYEPHVVASGTASEQSLHLITALDGSFPAGEFTLIVEAEDAYGSWEDPQEFTVEFVDGLEVDAPHHR